MTLEGTVHVAFPKMTTFLQQQQQFAMEGNETNSFPVAPELDKSLNKYPFSPGFFR